MKRRKRTAKPRTTRRLRGQIAAVMLLLVLALAGFAVEHFVRGGDWEGLRARAEQAVSSLRAAWQAAERQVHGTLSPAPSPYSADAVRLYFAPTAPGVSGDIDDALLALLASARTSIDAALYDLEWMPAAQALIAQHRAGVTVRLVTDSEYDKRAALQAVIDAGIRVTFDKRRPFMHNKFIVIDGTHVWTGSTNISENGLFRNNNNAVLFASQRLAENYTTEFEEMYLDRRFGGDSPAHTPFPHLQIGPIRVECYFAPEDQVRREILAELDVARRSIDFMAFSFTSREIAEAMAARHRAGVRVRGLFETRNANDEHARDDYLRGVGAEIHLDTNPSSMHHKVIVVDAATVITGSYNFSNAAEERNDENVLIIHDPGIAGRFVEEFERLTR